MNLEDKIMTDLKSAMKAKDQAALRSIRAIKAAILLAKTDGSGKELDGAAEIKLLQKLVKQRQDSYDIFAKENRPELAQKEKEEIDVIKRYLPEQMDEDELMKVVQEIVNKVGATSMKDMGKVMGLASAQLAGKSDGKTISTIVKKILS